MILPHYKSAEDMMKKTGLSPEECLKIINAEIELLTKS
jgi:hypothetical protein